MAVLEDILFFALDTFSEHPEKASLYSSIPYIAKINSLGSDWSVDRERRRRRSSVTFTAAVGTES